MHVSPALGNLEDRIADHLPGSVVCDVATSPDIEQFDPARPERLRIRRFSARALRPMVTTGSCSSRSNVSTARPRFPFVDEPVLEREAVAIGETTEAPDIERPNVVARRFQTGREGRRTTAPIRRSSAGRS